MSENNDLIRIFPNPARDFLNIEIEGYDEGDITEISIHDLMGRKIMQMEPHDAHRQIKLDLGMLPPGLYLLKLTIKGEAVLFKFIKL